MVEGLKKFYRSGAVVFYVDFNNAIRPLHVLCVPEIAMDYRIPRWSSLPGIT